MRTAGELYKVLFSLTFASYIWLGWQSLTTPSLFNGQIICLFKLVSGIPCPSCGITTALLLLLKGNWLGSLYANPIGILAFSLLLIIPTWLCRDILKGQHSLYLVYRDLENYIKKLHIAIPLLLLLISNWTWNIFKAL